MAGSFTTVQSKTILAPSCGAVRSEIDQPKTLCNLAGIYIASQGGFQFRYELLLQRINDGMVRLLITSVYVCRVRFRSHLAVFDN
jgi:hypothetical protein